MSKEEIAKRVEETLRDASYLERRGKVQQWVISGRPTNVVGGLEPIEFHVRMARDRLYCEVYKDGRLETAFAWLNGRVQEYRPKQEGDILIEYEAPGGIRSTRLSEGLGCLYGSQMQTWVGPLSRYGRLFRERIENSEQLPDQEVGGRACYVFKQSRTTCANEPLEHTHYVDQVTFLILRWDSLHQGIHRVRLYEPLSFGDRVPDEARWNISVNSAQERANPG